MCEIVEMLFHVLITNQWWNSVVVMGWSLLLLLIMTRSVFTNINME